MIKLIQAAGLTFILIGFFLNFPQLMDMRMFLAGAFIFTFGWILQYFFLKK